MCIYRSGVHGKLESKQVKESCHYWWVRRRSLCTLSCCWKVCTFCVYMYVVVVDSVYCLPVCLSVCLSVGIYVCLPLCLVRVQEDKVLIILSVCFSPPGLRRREWERGRKDNNSRVRGLWDQGTGERSLGVGPHLHHPSRCTGKECATNLCDKFSHIYERGCVHRPLECALRSCDNHVTYLCSSTILLW